MAVPPPRPSPDDFDVLSRVFDWLYQWANVLLTGIIATVAGFLWRTSASVAEFKLKQEEHGKAIAELKTLRETQSAKIETLATKDDLAEMQGAITGELRSRMSDMTQLIVRSK